MTHGLSALPRCDGVTVVVPTCDRPTALGDCLTSLLATTGVEFEVLVVDQSQDDATRKLVSMIGDPHIRYVRACVRGKSRALNLALKHSRFELLALADDDITVPPEWLLDGTSVLQNRPEVALVFGAVRAVPHDRSRSFIPEFIPTRERLIRSRFGLQLPRAGMGASAFTRRSAVQCVGGWSEHLGPGSIGESGDDWDLAYRLLKSGWQVLVSPRPSVLHSGGRLYADGSARRLIERNYRGIGVGLGCYLRGGDYLAGILLGTTTLRCMCGVLMNGLSWRRPFGVRRLVALATGLRAALSAAVNTAD